MRQLKQALELLSNRAERELELLEQVYSSKAVALINEMKERTGYSIDVDFDTGIDDLDNILHEFSLDWDRLNFDIDLVASVVKDTQ